MAIKFKDLESKVQSRIAEYAARIEECIDRKIENEYGRYKNIGKQQLVCTEIVILLNQTGTNISTEGMLNQVLGKIETDYRAAGWEYAKCSQTAGCSDGIHIEISLVKSSDELAKQIKERLDDALKQAQKRHIDPNSNHYSIYDVRIPTFYYLDPLFLPKEMESSVETKIKKMYADSGWVANIGYCCGLDHVELHKKQKAKS